MQSHERDDRHSRTHPVRTTAKHQNGHSNSGRGNEKAPHGEPYGASRMQLVQHSENHILL